MKIEEGNKLIAEFMSTENPNGQRYWLHIPDKELGRWIELRDLKYHTSWDWLMPVVEKMKCYIAIDDNSVYIHKLGESKQIYFEVNIAESLILATWEAVVDFIQWYNTQQSKP